MTAETVGNFVKARRTALGKTQKELAQTVSLSPAAFSAAESGKAIPTPKTLGIIAKGLQLTEDEREQLTQIAEKERIQRLALNETVESFVTAKITARGLNQEEVIKEIPAAETIFVSDKNQNHVPEPDTLVLLANTLKFTKNERKRLAAIADKERAKRQSPETIGSFVTSKIAELGVMRKTLVAKHPSLAIGTLRRLEKNLTVPKDTSIQVLSEALDLTADERKKLAGLVRNAREKRRKPKQSGDLKPNEDLFLLEIEPLDPQKTYSETHLASRSHSEVLVYLSEKTGKTFFEIATEAKLNNHTVYRIVNEKTHSPFERTLIKLRSAFELPEDTLLFRKKSMFRESRMPVIETEALKQKDFDEKTPGEKMQSWRQKKGLSRLKVAEMLHVAEARIRALDKGVLPPRELFPQISEVYGITVEEIEMCYGIKRPSPEEFEAMTLAEFIKHHRGEKEMSQDSLAKKMGCNRASIMNLENGQLPTEETLNKLVAAFGWSLDDEKTMMLRTKKVAARTKRNRR